MFWDTASTALPDIERAVFLYRNLDDLPNLGGALIPLGYSLFALGKIVEAEQTIVEAIGLLEPARQLRTLARAYCIQACIETALSHEDRARVAEKKAEQLCKIVGADRMSLGLAANLVQLSLESGDVDGAISAGRDMLARLDDSRYSDIRGFVFGVLAAALTSRGDLDGALTAAREAAPLLREEGTLIWLFDHLALRVALAGRAKDAALIAGYAEAAYQRTGRTREPMSREARDRLDSLLRDRLLDNEIVEEARLGTQLLEEQTLAIALGA
jgi:tetratricopeptide (TPR) repeat protein